MELALDLGLSSGPKAAARPAFETPVIIMSVLNFNADILAKGQGAGRDEIS